MPRARLLPLILIALSAVLTAQKASKSDPKQEPFAPAVVRMGATIAETRTALEKLCTKITIQEYKRPFIALRELVKDKQTQLDCDGFMYFGKPRWAEFIFADDSLELVWILTDKSDEPALLNALIAASGQPTHRNDKFIATAKGRIAIRTDKPESLFYSERIAKHAEGWFAKESTFR